MVQGPGRMTANDDDLPAFFRAAGESHPLRAPDPRPQLLLQSSLSLSIPISAIRPLYFCYNTVRYTRSRCLHARGSRKLRRRKSSSLCLRTAMLKSRLALFALLLSLSHSMLLALHHARLRSLQSLDCRDAACRVAQQSIPSRLTVATTVEQPVLTVTAGKKNTKTASRKAT